MKRTNEYRIRNLWTTEQLACALIRYTTEDEWDYTLDDELYVCGERSTYTTSDENIFEDYNEAVQHEIWWLSQESEVNI